MKIQTLPYCITVFFLLLAMFPCTGTAAQAILNGAGATFPSPLYRKWIDVYQAVTSTRISYKDTGSTEGIRLLRECEVDFGATDAFLPEYELETEDNLILHVPTCLGAVAVTYHLPEKLLVYFSGELIADIFMGKITRWNDPRIVKENPHIQMPEMEITVVHRSDGSGTSFIFTDYLTKVSPSWGDKIGRGKSVRWATGIGVEGNPGVSEFVKRIPGAIGYVSLNYAQENSLAVARIKNRAGQYIEPNTRTVSAAANKTLPGHMRVLLTDTSAADGYPISAFTYLIVYQEQHYLGRPRSQAEALYEFLWWIIHDGQKFADGLFYAPLSFEVIELSEATLRKMTFQGVTIWK